MEDLDLKMLIQNVGLIAEEKNLPEEKVVAVIEEAVAAAWRRDSGDKDWRVRAELNLNTGQAKVFRIFEVVAEIEDHNTQITLDDAKKIKKAAKEGETVEEEFDASKFSRVAAQTAKQVVIQKLREAEREVILEEYRDKVGEILTGNVARVTARVVVVEIGKAVAIMPKEEQVPNERYGVGMRIKALFKEIQTDERGSQMILSRADANFVKELFVQEVPELDTGAVEIKNIVREASFRTKVAVTSPIAGVDPVGTFVGGHGVRVGAVMKEINDEKIDIVVWDKDIKNYIANALSPAEISKIELDEKEKSAKVFVMEDQQSIAIGRSGQNVRLASLLTGYKLDIEPMEVKKPTKKTVSSKDLENALVNAADEE
jgi:N utilization substance protein A